MVQDLPRTPALHLIKEHLAFMETKVQKHQQNSLVLLPIRNKLKNVSNSKEM
jgi:hypothetical protein